MQTKVTLLLVLIGLRSCNQNTETMTMENLLIHTHDVESTQPQVDILEKAVVAATSVSPEYL